MNDDVSNQNSGSVFQGSQQYLVETNLGNGYLINQFPGLKITFQAIGGDGAEKEVARHRVNLSADQLKTLHKIPHNHTLGFDNINSSVIIKPKPTMTTQTPTGDQN